MKSAAGFSRADKMTAWRWIRHWNVKNDSPERIEPASGKPDHIDEGTDEGPGPLFS
jgi:hypothetical protein